GEPLDVQRLLFSESGKPRVAIISIAHLNDSERMFVVTLVLGEIVAWMRRQSGTSSLRALFYMDEIFGYFPPTAMPPSKPPLLTLMKQGRAFGLGVVLATQNPVDLDYKGLSNAGTWFIGRLQTERDKARVVEGLIAAGSGIEKSQFDTLLANLTTRVFLMRNAHEDAPVLFRSRWAMSYLRGPLTLPEIARLSPNAAALASTAPVSTASTITSAAKSSKPVVPASVIELFWKGEHNSYAPHLLGQVRMHFVNASAGVDVWETRSYALPLTSDADPDWARATIGGDVRASLDKSGNENATYSVLPASATRPESYKAWSRQLESYVYASAELELLSAPVVGATSVPGGSEADFRARIALALREKRDAAVDALRRKYSPKLIALQDQIRRAEDRVSREQSQLTQRKMETAINIGTSILGAFLGRKKISVTNASRIGTAARGAGRLGRDSEDVTRANEGLDVLKQRHEELEGEFNAESARVQAEYEPAAAVIDRVSIKPRKSDIEVTQIALVWMPA
ncbi:MAG: ATP-binding protein, partial [Povalibacter sp.]